jgi:Pyruvate/2-oxoacid:ferredoxin oxidoreductase gamma subunit
VIVANASMVKKDESRPDIQWVMVDFYQIAVEAGNQRTQNMAALGSLVRQLEGFSEADGFNIIKEKFGDKNPEMVEVNQKAYSLAYHS